MIYFVTRHNVFQRVTQGHPQPQINNRWRHSQNDVYDNIDSSSARFYTSDIFLTLASQGIPS